MKVIASSRFYPSIESLYNWSSQKNWDKASSNCHQQLHDFVYLCCAITRNTRWVKLDAIANGRCGCCHPLTQILRYLREVDKEKKTTDLIKKREREVKRHATGPLSVVCCPYPKWVDDGFTAVTSFIASLKSPNEKFSIEHEKAFYALCSQFHLLDVRGDFRWFVMESL